MIATMTIARYLMTTDELLVVGEPLVQDLQGDVAVQHLVVCQVHVGILPLPSISTTS